MGRKDGGTRWSLTAERSENKRDISVTENEIGDVRVAQGDLPGALSAFQAGLEISERLASKDPGNSGWQRDLIVSHWKLADAAMRADASDEGVGNLEEALVIAKYLEATGRLAPVDAFMPGAIEERFQLVEPAAGQ